MLTLGILAILGALGASIADSLLLGTAISGREFHRRGLDNLLYVPMRRQTFSHWFGILIIPLMGFGTWQVFRALEPAGHAQVIPLIAVMCYVMLVGTAAHGCFAPLGALMQLRQQATPADQSPLDPLINRFRRIVYIIFGTFLAGQLVSWVWFAILVWTQPTLYPAWMAFINPLIAQFVLVSLANFIPAPIGGYIAAANASIAMFVFFAASTWALH